MIFEYAGHRLDQLFIASNLEVKLAPPMPDLITVPGRDGQAVRGATLGVGTISVELSKTIGTDAERRAAYSQLWAWLNIKSPQQLRLGSVSDPYYLVMPSGGGDITRYIQCETVTAEFTVIEPARYGATRTASLSGSTAQNITVAGTYPTWLKIESTNATRNASGLWGVQIDNQDYVCVALPTAAASAVTIDSAEHLAEVDGAAIMITLDSDWLRLEPGTHSVKINKGSGSATISWIERWL